MHWEILGNFRCGMEALQLHQFLDYVQETVLGFQEKQVWLLQKEIREWLKSRAFSHFCFRFNCFHVTTSKNQTNKQAALQVTDT